MTKIYTLLLRNITTAVVLAAAALPSVAETTAKVVVSVDNAQTTLTTGGRYLIYDATGDDGTDTNTAPTTLIDMRFVTPPMAQAPTSTAPTSSHKTLATQTI